MSRETANIITRFLAASAWYGFLSYGCAAEVAQPEQHAQESKWELRESGSLVLEETPASLDGSEPGEALEKAGCSYIDWCNAPGPLGTVCIWTACDQRSAENECTRDAYAVCGGIREPRWFGRHP